MSGRNTKVSCLIAALFLFLSQTPLSAGDTLLSFLPNTEYKYDFETSAQLNGLGLEQANELEITFAGQVVVASVATDLFSVSLENVQLKSKDKRQPIEEQVGPVYIGSGDVYWTHSKDSSLWSLLRGIASLFDLDDSRDSDIVGSCKTAYEKTDNEIVKTKTDCSPDQALNEHASHPLALSSQVIRKTIYSLNADGTVKEINHEDRIESQLVGNKKTGSVGLHTIKIKAISTNSKKTDAMTGPEYIDKYSLKKTSWKNYQTPKCKDESCVTLEDYMEFRKQDFSKANIGSDKLALTTINTVLDMTQPTAKEVIKVLGMKKAQSIRGQLLDILGALQSWEPYIAVMESLFGKEDASDDLERYFQVLSVGGKPEKRIIEDILRRLEEDKFDNSKLKSTFIQTVSSMAHNYGKLSHANADILDDVDNYLWTQYTKCKENDCKELFLRGFVNLKLVNKIPQLLAIVTDGNENKLLATIAMKALQHFQPEVFDQETRKTLKNILHQRFRKFDSSIRTLALDILLKGKVDRAELLDILHILRQNDKSYEVKQYVLEKVKILNEKCPRFGKMLKEILRNDPGLNNYHRIGTGGLTTALTRQFLRHPSLNSSILSVQEIEKGVLKRGIVDMFFTKDRSTYSYFTLELFARGMSAFVGGGDKADDDDTAAAAEEETLTAGMEISVNGHSLRPLVFFSGQGELMGHVWSGTASDPTPAYQATTLFFDQRYQIPLQSGFNVQYDILTAISIDLKGQVSLSLWHRNGNSKVEQNIGLATVGRVTLHTDFSTTQLQFQLLQTPKLNLISNFEFSGDQSLCLQLSQPDLVLRKSYRWQNRISILKIADDATRNQEFSMPGNSHLLNAKNNEMCRKIHHNEL